MALQDFPRAVGLRLPRGHGQRTTGRVRHRRGGGTPGTECAVLSGPDCGRPQPGRRSVAELRWRKW